jgi:hypothetical protein
MATNRVRGFAPWRPQAKTRVLLDQVLQVLATYSNLLPLTGRQIFYRLVATTGYDKTEPAYKRLLELLNRARRARIIEMAAIRDDGAISAGDDRFSSGQDFLKSCQHWAASFQLDFMQYQPHHVEVLCEAGGMVPQLERVAEPYGVAVRSSGGFDSTTVKHQLGRLYGTQSKPVVVLHVGDLDPSGEHICSNLAEDVGAFTSHYGGELSVLRIAVTEDQQAAFDLPTAPTKPTDRRSFSAAFTVQAEALPPDALASIVRNAIEQQLDMAALAQAIDHQQVLRADLQRRVATLLTES